MDFRGYTDNEWNDEMEQMHAHMCRKRDYHHDFLFMSNKFLIIWLIIVSILFIPFLIIQGCIELYNLVKRIFRRK